MTTYGSVKLRATAYQAAKRRLTEPGSPFAGWIITGASWQQFNAHGDVVHGLHLASDEREGQKLEDLPTIVS